MTNDSHLGKIHSDGGRPQNWLLTVVMAPCEPWQGNQELVWTYSYILKKKKAEILSLCWSSRSEDRKFFWIQFYWISVPNTIKSCPKQEKWCGSVTIRVTQHGSDSGVISQWKASLLPIGGEWSWKREEEDLAGEDRAECPKRTMSPSQGGTGSVLWFLLGLRSTLQFSPVRRQGRETRDLWRWLNSATSICSPRTHEN